MLSLFPLTGCVIQLSDWYHVDGKVVWESGGHWLLRKYIWLPYALKAVYPEHPWNLSFFDTRAKWQHLPGDNLSLALDFVEQRIGIRKVGQFSLGELWKIYFLLQPEDWYSVNLTDIKQAGLPRRLRRTELVQLLSQKYPEYQWEKMHLLRGRFAQQSRLERAVASIFPVHYLSSIHSSLLSN